MKIHRGIMALVALSLCAPIVPPAAAADGQKFLPEPDAANIITLDQPGYYKFHKDIQANVEVLADGVVIDLNCMKLTAADPTKPALQTGFQVQSFRMHNGAVDGGSENLSIQADFGTVTIQDLSLSNAAGDAIDSNADELTLENVSAGATVDIHGPAGVYIDGVRVSYSGSTDALRMDGVRGQVTDFSAHYDEFFPNPGRGLVAQNSTGLRIQNAVITNAEVAIEFINVDSSSTRNVVIDGARTRGLVLDNASDYNQIGESTITGTQGGAGIFNQGRGNSFVLVESRDNVGGAGIEITSQANLTTLRSNTAIDNNGPGDIIDQGANTFSDGNNRTTSGVQ